MDRLKKQKEFLEKLRLTDSDYQDSGMINHIADLLERYHSEQLNLSGVINWVAVDKQKPPTIDLLYLTYNGDEMLFRYWNSTYFEGEHIASEPKVTHWAIVKPPCL